MGMVDLSLTVSIYMGNTLYGKHASHGKHTN